MTSTSSNKNQLFFILLLLVTSYVILVIDILIPLGVASGVLYIVVILLAKYLFPEKNKYLLYSAILTSLLILVGYYFSPSGAELWKIFSNRFLSVFAIWVTAFLVTRINVQAQSKILIEKRISEEREESIKEKESLLKEIHHRVKNNLQIITGLIGLQAHNIDDEKTKNLFMYSQYRINSMAKIHEMLYQTNDFSKIDYLDYLQQLISGLIISMKRNDNNIELDIKKTTDIYLNINTSIPLGLIVNEIITNSLKYGVKEAEKSVLSIQIKKTGSSKFIMEIGDNGVGLPDNLDIEKTKSLGLKLVHNLVQQLRGSIEIDHSKKGTNYLISFQEI